jgi:DNA invertase Pin-like site-specific DNA recombinase
LVESGPAEALAATKIDRVSRSVADFATLVCWANKDGWALEGHALRDGPTARP